MAVLALGHWARAFSSCGEWGPVFVALRWPLACWLLSWQLPGSRAPAQRWWLALRHVGSSWTKDQTCIPCAGRQILYHWAMRKAPGIVSIIILVPSNWISKSILVYVFCMIYWVFTKRKSFDFIKTDDLSLKIAFTIFMHTKEIIFFELCVPFSLLLHCMSVYMRLWLSY